MMKSEPSHPHPHLSFYGEKAWSGSSNGHLGQTQETSFYLLEQIVGKLCIVKKATVLSEKRSINRSRWLILEAFAAGNNLKHIWSHFEENYKHDERLK